MYFCLSDMLGAPTFAAPMVAAHLLLEPLDPHSPPEHAALLAPLRSALAPANDAFRAEWGRHFARELVLDQKRWAQRPHTLFTHMVVHADNAHALQNLSTALSTGRAVANAAGAHVAHAVFWGGGAFAAVDPLGLAQLQLERRSARAVAELLAPFSSGGQHPALDWLSERVGSAAAAATTAVNGSRQRGLGSSGGCYALASFSLCDLLVPLLEGALLPDGGGQPQRRRIRDGQLLPTGVDSQDSGERLWRCLPALLTFGLPFAMDVAGQMDGVLSGAPSAVGHGAHLSGAVAGALGYVGWRAVTDRTAWCCAVLAGSAAVAGWQASRR